MAEDIKVRTSGIRVFHEESSKYGIIWNLKGSDLVKVLWDDKDGEQSGGNTASVLTRTVLNTMTFFSMLSTATSNSLEQVTLEKMRMPRL